MSKLKNWKKIEKKDMAIINGGGVGLTLWTVGIVSLIVFKSIWSPKASIAINGMGRASWENDEKTKSFENESNHKNNDQALQDFINKFYEV